MVRLDSPYKASLTKTIASCCLHQGKEYEKKSPVVIIVVIAEKLKSEALQVAVNVDNTRTWKDIHQK